MKSKTCITLGKKKKNRATSSSTPRKEKKKWKIGLQVPHPEKKKKIGGSLVIDATIPPSPPLFSPQNEQIEFG